MSREFWRGARAAAVFLTRVPVGGFPYTRQEWQWSSGWFPAIGALIGLASAAVFWAIRPAGSTAAAIASIAASLLITGAFHEDGLADTADALGGAYDRENVLRILKDSRIGTFGGAALVVSIALRACTLAVLDQRALFALPLVHVLARVAPIWQMKALPYVTSDDASRSRHVARAKTGQAVLATSFGAIALVLAVAFHAIDVTRAACLVTTATALGALTAWRYRVRTGGVTGDFLGATEQLGECGLLLVLAWNA